MAGNKDPMLDIFIFETLELIDKLEQHALSSEKEGSYIESINEIFRIMHTIKGNSAMMLFDNISKLAHSVEDLFDLLRKDNSISADSSKITDIILKSSDFVKGEIEKIEQGHSADGDAGLLVEDIENYLQRLKENELNKDVVFESKQEKVNINTGKYYISSKGNEVNKDKHRYKVKVFFENDCQMENVRAFTLVHNLKEISEVVEYFPDDIIENNESSEVIKLEGFALALKTEKSIEEIKKSILATAFIEKVEINIFEEDNVPAINTLNKEEEKQCQVSNNNYSNNSTAGFTQSVLNVSVERLDKLMDLVGELVIAESMVTKNPEIEGQKLDSFYKAARQLKKIIIDIQDVVMSVRMVPLSSTFRKMNRLVRDMNKKLGKNVQLEIIGEETEVDKNIIEHISDPLMHLIRNSMDHGIELTEERKEKGKDANGKITLEAKNEGGDVWIIVKDDGQGLDRKKILKKAMEHGLIRKAEEELSDKEVYSFILLPGFSTNEQVTEFSGRGVGMDVVVKDIEKIRGTVIIDSKPGEGTTISIKIPLTLAIIDGMVVRVGKANYIIPTTSIKESFKVDEKDIITDLSGNEMIMVRGKCYPVIRLHKLFGVKSDVRELQDGIITIVENESNIACLLIDELIGQQQVVIKAMPEYIKRVRGIAGCTLLGNGSISLILDIAGILAD